MDLQYFSSTYLESRAKFLAALAAAGGAHLAAHENPRRGPAGEALYTDIARIGPADAKRLLILVSGTHGIEGYAGSGCHTAWLARGCFDRQIGDDTAVLFIHAINPFGFAGEAADERGQCRSQPQLHRSREGAAGVPRRRGAPLPPAAALEIGTK